MKTLAFALGFLLASTTFGELAIKLLNPTAQWEVAEFEVAGAPAFSNVFAPEPVTAVFTAPSGAKVKVAAFWNQEFSSKLEGSSEKLASQGEPGWRVRYTPAEPGQHAVEVSGARSTFAARPARRDNPFSGPVRIAANNRYFETNGSPLVLNGKNVCWHGSRGTFDYRDWFPAMRKAGENYARLWMAPWAFGIETDPNTLNKYRLDRAWQLDEVCDLALQNGIYLMLCFEYHGMYQTKPDFWGANNNWKINPYNAENGGPCGAPNDFFTNKKAKALYKMRLSYLIARYGAYPNLLCWQFFNEIDNVYNLLKGPDVANWHREMGAWLRENDPFGRLVTTSLTGSSDRAEIWSLPQMDFAMFHSYGLEQPAAKLPGILEGMRARYKKPVMLGEYGIDFRGFKREADPHFRGLRQGIWAGLLGGSVGTGMSWWWESLHAHHAYTNYAAVAEFLSKTKLGRGEWNPIQFGKSDRIVAAGLMGGSEAVLYVLNSAVSYPENVTATNVPAVEGESVILKSCPEGRFAAEWIDAATGKRLCTTSASSTGQDLVLPLPSFSEDIAAVLRRER